jgi:CheY-like chemotaxis protein
MTTAPAHFSGKGEPTMKVLIVDDNPIMRRLIKRLVLSPEDDCFECADGADALSAYEQHHLDESDWVLMDVEMGRMDGLSATRELHAAHPEARVIIVTKHKDENMRAAALNHGAFGFVPKENLLELRSLLSSNHSLPGHGLRGPGSDTNADDS